MSTHLDLNHPLLEIIQPECTTRLFGGGQLKVPDFDPDHLLFHVIVAPDGARQFKAIGPREAGGRIPGNPYDLLARVRRECPGFPLAFPRQHTDAQGHAWDMLLSGTLKVEEPKRFAEQASGFASVGAPLRRDRLSLRLVQDLGAVVRDRLRAELDRWTFEDLRDRNVLPAPWWLEQFAPVFERLGLRLAGAKAGWESATAARAEQLERDRQAQAQVQQQFEEEGRQRLEQARRAAEHARRLAEIEAEAVDLKRDLEIKGILSRDQQGQAEKECRQRQLQMEMKFREEQAAGDHRLRELQWTIERQALEHEMGMLSLRDQAGQERQTRVEEQRRLQEDKARRAELDQQKLAAELAQAEAAAKQAVAATEAQRELAALRIERLRHQRDRAALEVTLADQQARTAELERQKAVLAVQQAQGELQLMQERRQQAEQLHLEQTRLFQEMKSDFKNLFNGFSGDVLAALFQRDPANHYNAAGWITSQGFTAQRLQNLGIHTPLGFIERLQHSTVQIRKNNLKRQRYSMRDIVSGSTREVEIDTLPVREPVDFEFTTPRAGFVTIINPGTSGKFWLHVPNAYHLLPRVEAGRTYQVPGPDLLPEERLQAAGLAYFERGPAGWEFLAVIVSDEPLLDGAVSDRSKDAAPVVELSAEELQGALDRLDRMGREHWAAGVARFRVEDN